MGKQLNYWMDYDSFLLVARKAVDLGCTIVKEDLNSGKVIESSDVSIVTQDEKHYYFHLLDAGDIKIHSVNGKERLNRGFNASSNAIIEAGYSFIVNEPTGPCGHRYKKEIRRTRIYCIMGYYDENNEYIQRPECLTKVYDSLARYVKKLAPYTEIIDVRVSKKHEDYGKEYEYRDKVYITRACLDMVNNEGYKLS